MKIPLLILMAALISIFLTSNTIIASEKTKQNNQHDQESTYIPHTSKKPEILQKNQLWLESFTGINFVPIPGGMFEIGDQFEEGDQDEKETRNVKIKPFFLGQTEITQSQWKRVMGSNPSRRVRTHHPLPLRLGDFSLSQEKRFDLYVSCFFFILVTLFKLISYLKHSPWDWNKIDTCKRLQPKLILLKDFGFF